MTDSGVDLVREGVTSDANPLEPVIATTRSKCAMTSSLNGAFDLSEETQAKPNASRALLNRQSCRSKQRNCTW